MNDRYLVQFRNLGKPYAKTDCAFQDGLLEKAKAYADWVFAADQNVFEAIVYDQQSQEVVYHLGVSLKIGG